ncbi:MAG: ATP-binding cassette domain-containing protein [Chloroflexi bacterium]|nr:ATP-binding cassette domain-containing protein [Chloroflexota bacterium]
MDPLELIDITKRYRTRAGRQVLALDHVSLAIPGGQIAVLLGSSGAGKTTLLRIACGSQRPTGGVVRVCSQTGNAISRGSVSALLPGFRFPYPRASLQENLPADDLHPEWAACLLQALDLEDRKDDPVYTLPQTLQNRLALACTLLAGSGVILLDESPVLDVSTIHLLFDWLPGWVHALDKAVIIAARQPSLVLSLADRLAVLRRGRLVFDSAPQVLEGAREQINVRIRVSGMLEAARSTWFQGLSTIVEGNDTLICGDIEDDAALFGLIMRVRGLGLSLLSLEQLNPGIEQRLQQLME